MLYYLLIQSVFGKMQPVQGMILYSSQSLNPLRAAPLLDELRNDLIHLRNSIILLHLHLAFRTPEDVFILDLIQESGFQSTETYAKRDAMQMWQIYSSLSAIEKNYFKELSGFIAREQIISKMGRSDSQYTEGMASLWLLSESEKRHHFMILHDLKIKEIIHQTGEFPILILTQNIGEENISNFRKGDTLVLYPGHSALNEQIYKCTLVEHHPNEYHIRLRTRQFPDAEQSKIKKWNLEHDYIDRSFQYHFQGLLEFSQSEPEQRELIMGLRAPQKKQELSFVELKDVPEMIAPVIEKMISSKDYFLLWGPPGSGKTSLVIRYLSKVLNSETNEHILLLAYTNRAVDEMCEALEAEDLNYIRIGSRFAIQDKFRKNLLEEKINGLKNRKQLIQLFNNTRIFTATIASIQGKKELFLLKKFDTVIIDEASQILESQLTGLLTKFNRFMLIGDHMQLPAVSTQSESECAYKSPQLLDAGYKNMSTSLFERLLQQCKNNSWDHAYSMLTHQGRMHQDVMNFPGRVFYNNQLQILPDRDYQKADYAKSFIFESQISQHPLANNRTLFVSSSTQEVQFPSKTNPTEARIISKLVKDLYELHQKHQLKWHELNLGIITPFRAQIAQIRMELDREGLTAIPLSVDTAERYQGSTRNIIILSTVISDVSQLPQISSINEQGIDRKLNVALTRAREQVILVGNREVLSTSPLYKALLDEYQELQPW
jgi:DNA replication ATP-dependent helicase Dna2